MDPNVIGLLHYTVIPIADIAFGTFFLFALVTLEWIIWTMIGAVAVLVHNSRTLAD